MNPHYTLIDFVLCANTDNVLWTKCPARSALVFYNFAKGLRWFLSELKGDVERTIFKRWLSCVSRCSKAMLLQ